MITPITPEDEELRQEKGLSGPQNYTIPFGFYNEADYYRLLKQKKPKLFYNHAPAMFINILNPQDRLLIEQICKNEIRYFSYSW